MAGTPGDPERLPAKTRKPRPPSLMPALPRRGLERRTSHALQSCGITQRLRSRVFPLKEQRNTRTWAIIATSVATTGITLSTAEPAKPLGGLYYPYTPGKRPPMTLPVVSSLPPWLALKGIGPPPKETEGVGKERGLPRKEQGGQHRGIRHTAGL